MNDQLKWNQSLLWSEIADARDETLNPEAKEFAVTKNDMNKIPTAVSNTQLGLEDKEDFEAVLSNCIPAQKNQSNLEKTQKKSISFLKACGVLSKFLLRLVAYSAFVLVLLGVILCTIFSGSLQQDVEIIRDFYIKGALVAPFLCMPLAFYITLQNWVYDYHS